MAGNNKYFYGAKPATVLDRLNLFAVLDFAGVPRKTEMLPLGHESGADWHVTAKTWKGAQ